MIFTKNKNNKKNKNKTINSQSFKKLILSEWKKIKLKLSHMFSSKGKKKTRTLKYAFENMKRRGGSESPR